MRAAMTAGPRVGHAYAIIADAAPDLGAGGRQGVPTR